MRLLADVHVKSAYVTALGSDGHTIERVVDVASLGATATDARIVSYAREQDAVVVTNDAKDFERFETHPGVIIVPQLGVSAGTLAACVARIERAIDDPSDLVLYATSWA